jgi:hypothetical protein
MLEDHLEHGDKIYTTFDEIQNEIKSESIRPSSHKNPIDLKIHSPNVFNWTICEDDEAAHRTPARKY